MTEISLDGVGTQVAWAWDQVTAAIKESSGAADFSRTRELAGGQASF